MLFAQKVLNNEEVAAGDSKVNRYETLLVLGAHLNRVGRRVLVRLGSRAGRVAADIVEGEKGFDNVKIADETREVQRGVAHEVFRVYVVFKDVTALHNKVDFSGQYSIVDECVPNFLVFIVSLEHKEQRVLLDLPQNVDAVLFYELCQQAELIDLLLPPPFPQTLPGLILLELDSQTSLDSTFHSASVLPRFRGPKTGDNLVLTSTSRLFEGATNFRVSPLFSSLSFLRKSMNFFLHSSL